MIGPDADDQVACAGLLARAVLGRDTDVYLEIRGIRPGIRPAQQWLAAAEIDEQLPEALQAAAERNLYMGALPRIRRAGGADAVDNAWVLWVDLDDEQAIARLADFTPRPHILISTGTGTNRHAWWSLREPLAAAHAERANRRLAHHLGGDMRAVDRARVLRIPGTLNHKHQPPRPVICEHLDAGRGHTAREIVGDLPDPPYRLLDRRFEATLANRAEGDDVLLNVPASEYVPILTGRQLGRDFKVACPFHEDRTPSMHAWPDASRGFCCFGCGRSGDIYTFGGLLYGLEPRGPEFREIRRRLATDLLRAVAA
jgi:hypothetical protein